MLELLTSFLTPTIIKWTVIIGGLLSAYLYVHHVMNENAVLQQNNATLTSSLQQEKDTLASLEKDHEAVLKAQNDLQISNQNLQKQQDDLQKALDGKVSLDVLNDKQTKDVETNLNSDLLQSLSCFETISKGGSC